MIMWIMKKGNEVMTDNLLIMIMDNNDNGVIMIIGQ